MPFSLSSPVQTPIMLMPLMVRKGKTLCLGFIQVSKCGCIVVDMFAESLGNNTSKGTQKDLQDLAQPEGLGGGHTNKVGWRSMICPSFHVTPSRSKGIEKRSVQVSTKTTQRLNISYRTHRGSLNDFFCKRLAW